MFLLKALAPEKFREQRTVRVDVTMMDRRLEQLRQYLGDLNHRSKTDPAQAEQLPLISKAE